MATLKLTWAMRNTNFNCERIFYCCCHFTRSKAVFWWRENHFTPVSSTRCTRIKRLLQENIGHISPLQQTQQNVLSLIVLITQRYINSDILMVTWTEMKVKIKTWKILYYKIIFKWCANLKLHNRVNILSSKHIIHQWECA